MNPADSEPGPNPWPLYARVLAVLHVLARPLGFLGLSLAAGALFWQQGGWDFRVVSMFIAALACPVLGASYRRWFENFGRRRWPDGKYVPSPQQEHIKISVH